ncbi:MAG: RecQ family ATP-dependent DNA helicase [Treponema sp.]|jgi:ATP-dependent DNA helicase RecQ|nr:RecQ family ATP-dependent DNA helicase [Treponema sp.]
MAVDAAGGEAAGGGSMDAGGAAAYDFRPPDPLDGAVRKLFGIPYLFPYQRLVVSNILEAAAAAGVTLRWPEDGAGPGAGCFPEDGAAAGDAAPPGPGLEEAGIGRQIVILPTGAGKSLCFQLPAMLLEGPTLVIYPILSLMADQERRLRERGFEPAVLRGGQDEGERNRIWEGLASGRNRFIIANPEVLLTPSVMGRLRKLRILHIVIDEAHCVSEWGESFRPAYLRLREIVDAAGGAVPAGTAPGALPGTLPGALPLVTAFTATASAPVLEKIERYVFGAPVHRIVGNPDRGNISYAARGCILRDLAVRDLLLAEKRPAIVFCSSRPGTENLARRLREELEDTEIRFYHAGLEREEKNRVEQWFFGSPRGILISTCAYGMGVDKADIRTVIHRDCPPSVEAYLQESGRAGRDGAPSRAILLWGPGDEGALRRAGTEAARRRLSALLDYARDTRGCRRAALLALLNYEGTTESPEHRCCDVCEGAADRSLREEGELLGFVRRNRRAYTLSEAAAALAEAERVRWSAGDAKQALGELVRMKKIRIGGNPLWKGRLTG